MSATPYQICEAVLQDIDADPEIKAAVASLCKPATSLTLMLGLDPSELPAQTTAPWFSITPTATDMPEGDNRTTRVHDLTCVLAVADESVKANGQIKKYTGMQSVYDLVKLLESRIFTSLQPINGEWTILETGRVTLNMTLPYHSATWTTRVGTAA